MPPRQSRGGGSPVSIRRTLAILAALIGLLVQYFVRIMIGGFGVLWVEEGLPFVVLDWLLAVVNEPVYRLLGLVYDPWAPDSVAFVALLSWYAILAVVTSALLGAIERRAGSERP